MEKVQDYIKLRGSLRLALKDPDGRIVQERIVKNLVVLGGRSWILGQLQTVNQNTALTISNLAVGSGTVAPVTSQTALGSEVTRKTIASFMTTNLTANPPSFDMVANFATNEANTTLSEYALFNSTAAGTMINRATFASFVKATSNTLSVTATISG